MLADDLAVILASRPGLTTAEITGALRHFSGTRSRSGSERSVTLALHAGDDRFESDGGSPPRWHLAGTAARVAYRAVLQAGGTWGTLPDLYAWQLEALAAWRTVGRRAVVEAVTGAGKTLVGLAAAKEELENGGQVLVLVPSVELMRQWRRRIASVLPSGYSIASLGDGEVGSLARHDVLVGVVNTVRSSDVRLIRASGLLVADECHRYGSPTNRLALDKRFRHRLGLSATYAREDDGHLSWLAPYFGRTCFRLGYARAVAEGVTARFRVALVAVQLLDRERAAYTELSEMLLQRRARLLGRFHLPAEPFGAFLASVLALAGPGEESGDGSADARAYLRLLQERRRLLADASGKLEALRNLAPALRGAGRAIVFGRSIEASVAAAKTLSGMGIDARTVHSGMSPNERRSVMDRFAAGEVQVLAAPQVLDEGVDVPEADLAVVLAASRSRRQMIQRMGRVLRVKNDGRPARFAIVFAEGTVEDPERGNCEAFLEEMLPVADDVRRFGCGGSDGIGAAVDYLR